jgi:hypothetical protein
LKTTIRWIGILIQSTQPLPAFNAAKHEGMKEAKTSPQESISKQILEAPAFLKIGNEVVRTLKEFVDAADRRPGEHLQQMEFGKLIGASKSTIHDWYHGEIPAPIKFCICALERLTEEQRVDLLARLCRPCIRLDHPRLAHNRKFIRWFGSVPNRPAGLTFLVGPSGLLREFVLTAIGNSVVRLFALKKIRSLDLRIPAQWAPVPGVTYFRQPTNTADLKNAVLQFWNSCDYSRADFLLFHSVWELVPELRRRIAELAKTRTVIVGDDYASGLEGRKPYLSQANIISLGVGPNARIDLRISLRKEAGEKSQPNTKPHEN